MGRKSSLRVLLTTLAFFFLVLCVLRFRNGHQPRLEFVEGSFGWNAVGPFYDPFPSTSPPTDTPLHLPRIQHGFPSKFRFIEALQANRRDVVKQTFLRNWRSYREFAWTKDELTPLTGGSKNTLGGWAATLVDALDTL